MSFLIPAFLFGALALALPVVFHLIRRHTRERLPFSSLLFLQPTPPRLTQRSRLEDLLLLLLRCLALALLAVGFARPFLKQPRTDDPAAGQPKRIVLLLDRSASMQRSGLWSAAVARAGEVLAQTTANDLVTVLAFDQEISRVLTFEDWQAASSGDRAGLARSRIEALKPGWAATQLGTALITAAETLTEAEVRQATPLHEVVLISDVQEGARLEKLQAFEWPKNLPLRVVPLKAKAGSNAGVQLVAEGADTGLTNAAVRVRVSNAPDATKEQLQVGWAAEDGSFLGAPQDVYVPPGQSRVVALPVPAAGTNAVELPNRVVLRGDDEPFDNVAFVIPPSPATLRVLYLGADAAGDSRQPLFFLRRALPETPRQRIEVDARPGNAAVTPADLAGAGLVFVTGDVSPAVAALLREQMQAGKTVVFAPVDASSGATLAALVGGGAVPLREATVRNYAMLTELDFTHPLFAPFADPRFGDFTKIHVWKHRVMDLTDVTGARVLAKFDSGGPALAEVPVGRGRVLVFATGWHPADSQWALSTKFVPLVVSLLDYAGVLAGLDAAVHLVGEAVPLRPGVRRLRLPDGSFSDLPAGTTNFTATLRPGLYRAEGDGATTAFAVNLDPNESRTAALPADVFETYGLASAAAPESGEVRAARRAQLQAGEAESRQKLWRWFLLGTLLVLFAEIALAGWTARRASPTEVMA
jgi:hypothetical protein